MKRILAALAALVLAVVSIAPAAIATTGGSEVLVGMTTSAVQIQTVRYNVHGTDRPSNAGHEYVIIRNYSSGDGQDMTGWTLEDAVGNAFTFPGDTATPFILASGARVAVHTGRRSATTDLAGMTNLYWERFRHVWANSGKDSVILYTAGGVRVDRFSWDDFTYTP